MRAEFETRDGRRILRGPAGVSAISPQETRPAFRLAAGKTFKVWDVDEIGWSEVELGAEADEAPGALGNAIRIEPDCVEAAAETNDSGSGPAGDIA